MSKIYVADGAKIVGNIDFDEDANVWYNAVIRNSGSVVSIGRGTNIQDNCTLHAEISELHVGENVTIGHGAIVHGCTVGDNTLIGMGAIILNRAKIGKNCVVGAGSLVTEDAVIPDNSLVVGSPARIIREVNEKDIERNRKNATTYVEMAKAELEQIKK